MQTLEFMRIFKAEAQQIAVCCHILIFASNPLASAANTNNMASHGSLFVPFFSVRQQWRLSQLESCR